jgi:hypothetical protein
MSSGNSALICKTTCSVGTSRRDTKQTSLPHLRQDWARPCHIHTVTGPGGHALELRQDPATSAPGREWGLAYCARHRTSGARTRQRSSLRLQEARSAERGRINRCVPLYALHVIPASVATMPAAVPAEHGDRTPRGETGWSEQRTHIGYSGVRTQVALEYSHRVRWVLGSGGGRAEAERARRGFENRRAVAAEGRPHVPLYRLQQGCSMQPGRCIHGATSVRRYGPVPYSTAAQQNCRRRTACRRIGSSTRHSPAAAPCLPHSRPAVARRRSPTAMADGEGRTTEWAIERVDA